VGRAAFPAGLLAEPVPPSRQDEQHRQECRRWLARVADNDPDLWLLDWSNDGYGEACEPNIWNVDDAMMVELARALSSGSRPPNTHLQQIVLESNHNVTDIGLAHLHAALTLPCGVVSINLADTSTTLAARQKVLRRLVENAAARVAANDPGLSFVSIGIGYFDRDQRRVLDDATLRLLFRALRGNTHLRRLTIEEGFYPSLPDGDEELARSVATALWPDLEAALPHTCLCDIQFDCPFAVRAAKEALLVKNRQRLIASNDPDLDNIDWVNCGLLQLSLPDTVELFRGNTHVHYVHFGGGGRGVSPEDDLDTAFAHFAAVIPNSGIIDFYCDGRRMWQNEGLTEDPTHANHESPGLEAWILKERAPETKSFLVEHCLANAMRMISTNDPSLSKIEWCGDERTPGRPAWADEIEGDIVVATDDVILQLARALRGNTHLRSIRFTSGYRLTDAAVKPLIDALRDSHVEEYQTDDYQSESHLLPSRDGLTGYEKDGLYEWKSVSMTLRDAVVEACAKNKCRQRLTTASIEIHRPLQRMLLAALCYRDKSSNGAWVKTDLEVSRDVLSSICMHLNASQLCPTGAAVDLRAAAHTTMAVMSSSDEDEEIDEETEGEFECSYRCGFSGLLGAVRAHESSGLCPSLRREPEPKGPEAYAPWYQWESQSLAEGAPNWSSEEEPELTAMTDSDAQAEALLARERRLGKIA
jgi:hypothetical protein